jgi:hypothetical protein
LAGLLLLAGCSLVGAIVVVLLRIDAWREQVSGDVAMAHSKALPRGLLQGGDQARRSRLMAER